MPQAPSRPSITGFNCDPNYSTPSGVPCVPAQFGDFNCRDLAQWGVSSISVVGQDVYSIDNDGDGHACEATPNPRTNDFGAWVSEYAGAGLLVGVVIALVVTAASGRWIVRLYRSADSDAERRGYRMGVAMLVFGAVPVALSAVALFAILGID